MKIEMIPSVLALLLLATGCAAKPDRRDDEAYHQSVEERLRQSADPRDQALAAVPLLDSAPRADRNASLAKAAASAPRDVLVQWLAATTLTPTAAWGESVPDAARARGLVALDPGNAAHWLLLLPSQAAAGDTAGVDETLARAAAASRFDEHFRDELLAWADAYDRFPQQGERPDAAVYSNVGLRAGDVFQSTTHALFEACAPAGFTPENSRARTANCEKIGHLMKSANLHSQLMIGRAIRFRLGLKTAADEEFDREWLWIQRKNSELASGQLLDPLFEKNAWGREMIEAWRELDNETAVDRRMIVRAGYSPTPPPGWQPDRKPAAAKTYAGE